MLNVGKICFAACAAVCVCGMISGCVTGADGESTFSPIAALQQGIDKLDSVPDDTKASVLEAIALLLGATGFGGGAAFLASKGASYYRNRGKGGTSEVGSVGGRGEISTEGVTGDVGS